MTGRCTRRAGLLPVLVVLLVAGPGPACAAQDPAYRARVVEVADGDTLVVERDGTTERLRLYGVDAPEAGQAYGREARDEARRLLMGRDVTVHPRETDAYGRTVAEVLVDGRDAGEALLEAGAAWHYRYYSDSDRYAALERQARAKRVGLWRDPDPTPPWQWREAARAANGGQRAAAVTAAQPPVDAPFVGNARSQVFHQRGCESFDCPNCTVPFASADEARRAGYRAHSCVRR
ncbi:MAG: thermonuclease family protein [Acidobacteriota bacterium]|nr:MAG: nuclease [Acidobacteriota bacterium]